MNNKSIFTRIIDGEIPAYKIYEDDKVIAILDIHPIHQGHTLVIPKKQVDHIWDLNDEDYDYLWKISKKIGKHIKDTLDSPRVGIVVEGFGVSHAHVHLVPIYKGNDLKLPQDMEAEPDHEALAIMVKRLKL